MAEIPKNSIPTICTPSVDWEQRERGTYEEDKELKALYEYYFELQKKKSNTHRNYKVIEKGKDRFGREVALSRCDFVNNTSGEIAITTWSVESDEETYCDTIIESVARELFQKITDTGGEE